MSDAVQPNTSRKKTPTDATAFEREQLRFFLSGGDLSASLAELNPSLAWLSVLYEMKLVESEAQLVGWVERNFADADAIREVVANIRFFGPETADFLQYRLNAQASTLPSLLVKCWEIIIRQMRTAKQGVVGSEWFRIQPQLKRGDYSPAVVQRLADVLCPKLKIDKRILWTAGEQSVPEKPSDLMSIDYEVDDSISADDVLATWSADVPAEIDERLLDQLTVALEAALDDAVDVGVEGEQGISTSDFNVLSVARHPQNEYRTGFQLIVRVMAEIWTRLAVKSRAKAIAFGERWRDSRHRLTRRLALFAFENPAVPAKFAADMLTHLPSGELFLTSAHVEVSRLLRARWKEFSTQAQRKILKRLREGPPRSWYREGANVEQHIDRARFDVLSDMTRAGMDIGAKGDDLFAKIQARWPSWKPRPLEQAGFHIWSESGPVEPGDDTDRLKRAPASKLLNEARRIAHETGFRVGDSWQGLCPSDPDRAVRGLDAAAARGDWSSAHWERLLWAQAPYADPGTELKIAELLLHWPHDSFDTVAGAASSWLHTHAKALPDDLVWPLWDRIADTVLVESAGGGHE
jgi:hypothetical protein